ncbi:hypothetical protein [Saccharothrix sp. HUAS TT1]|uniref:hypothetical protein n=1 Tax=unclassified Saccharothrix TaxID=2593673 RepID=UPI00345C1127
MGIKWQTGTKVVRNARAWASGTIPEQAGKDECMVCGKQVRRHRTVSGEGRVCSLTCAQYWAENMT